MYPFKKRPKPSPKAQMPLWLKLLIGLFIIYAMTQVKPADLTHNVPSAQETKKALFPGPIQKKPEHTPLPTIKLPPAKSTP